MVAQDHVYAAGTLKGNASPVGSATAYAIPAGYNTDQFSTDLATGDIGALNTVVPDQCDDMHSITVKGMDSATGATGISASDCSGVANGNDPAPNEAGDNGTLTPAERRGLIVFSDPKKGNCFACHYNGAGLRVSVATRKVFFHNGRIKSLKEAIRFYNTRDTNPELWYPSTRGTVQKYDDLPARFRGNLDKQMPLDGRTRGSEPPMTEQEMDDLEAFLNTLTDDYRPLQTQNE